MTIAVATIYHPNYQQLADAVMPNWQEYCGRHGYGLMVRCIPERGVQIGFEKMMMVMDTLFRQPCPPDAMFVLDLDILITNLTCRVEDIVAVAPERDYFVPTGFNGLCNGSFVIRRTGAAREILEYVLRNPYGHDNEQNTLKLHLDTEPVLKDRIQLFPYTAFGSFMLDLYPEHGEPTRERGNWEPGDFILHLAGLQLEKRLEIVNSERVRAAIVR